MVWPMKTKKNMIGNKIIEGNFLLDDKKGMYWNFSFCSDSDLLKNVYSSFLFLLINVRRLIISGKENEKSIKNKGCKKCGERCKKCGEKCSCSVKRIYVRAPMFNYYTDLMHWYSIVWFFIFIIRVFIFIQC